MVSDLDDVLGEDGTRGESRPSVGTVNRFTQRRHKQFTPYITNFLGFFRIFYKTKEDYTPSTFYVVEHQRKPPLQDRTGFGLVT